MKLSTKVIQIYLRQLSVIPKKNLIQIWHKEKTECYERNNW